jgi:hypothetical protein
MIGNKWYDIIYIAWLPDGNMTIIQLKSWTMGIWPILSWALWHHIVLLLHIIIFLAWKISSACVLVSEGKYWLIRQLSNSISETLYHGETIDFLSKLNEHVSKTNDLVRLNPLKQSSLNSNYVLQNGCYALVL